MRKFIVILPNIFSIHKSCKSHIDKHRKMVKIQLVSIAVVTSLFPWKPVVITSTENNNKDLFLEHMALDLGRGSGEQEGTPGVRGLV